MEAHDEGRQVIGGSMGLASSRWFERGVHLCKFHDSLGGKAGYRWILPTANASYSREAWRAAGPFDGDLFCGDALLSWRAEAAGYPSWFEPRAVVEHRHEGDVSSLWRQRLSRGREFAEARLKFETWSRLRAAVHLPALPVLVVLVLIRAGRNAASSGWFANFLSTLPLQFLGHLGWSLGEAKAHVEFASGRVDLSNAWRR